jgi:transposase
MWKAETRRTYDRKGLRYPTDLTDAEWALARPFIDVPQRGSGQRRVDLREGLNAVFYILGTGCQWRALPKDLPPRSTVHDYFVRWQCDGTLGRLHHALYEQARELAGKEASPTTAIVDSQSVKGAERSYGATDGRVSVGSGPDIWIKRHPMAFAATPASLAETASATLFVALELSRSTWLVALHSPLTNKVSQHRLDGGDADGLLALIARKQGQAQEKLGQPVRVVCCFEAGYDGFWLHRWLCARGIENRVLDAASLLVDRRARRAKTDRLDAAGLLRTLMALERGEAQVCRVVRVPTPEQEDARRRSRERTRLVVERGQHTSRIKGLLMTQGIRDFEPTRRDWQARFEALRTPDGLPLAPCLRAELLRECRRLWLVMEMIAEVEAEQKAVAEEEDGPAARLAQLRGIGLAFATVLGNEVFFRDFRNRREVGGYLGLAPSPWQSGSVRRDQGIAKSGNPRARRTAIELAWLWLRHQPGSTLARWFHERVGSSKGRLRRIMLVAMARKLIVALWRYVTCGTVPEGAVLKI